MVAFEV